MFEYADIILKSNAVFTGLSEQVFKGGIAITQNLITAVGNDIDIDRLIGPKTKVYEYDEEMIMPGFIDSHIHFFLGALVASEYMLTDIFASTSEAECISMLEAFANEHPDFDRIVGIGWFPANWTDNKLPHRASIDKVISNKPVYLIAADGHTVWVNSKALEVNNITKDTTVSLGEIGKDEKGELNGLLFEIEACGLVLDHAITLPKDIMINNLKTFMNMLAACGITSVSDMSSKSTPEGNFEEYETVSIIEKNGELGLRLHLYPALGLDCNLDKAKALKKQYCSDKLRISGLKQFVDGVTSTYTGYLLEKYADNPDTKGFLNYSVDTYRSNIINANKEGFGVRLHTIGDGAVRLGLDIFEESNKYNSTSNVRNCLEHCETINPDDIPRFSQLGVIASIQPYHLILDANEKISRVGEERCKYEWPLKSLLDSKALLAFSTDFPISSFNPFPNIYAAITRCDMDGIPTGINPEEKVSLFEALKAYTFGGAYSYNRENELGTLEVGKLADVIVLNKNLFSIPSKQILETSVKLTIFDGKVIFDDKVSSEI